MELHTVTHSLYPILLQAIDIDEDELSRLVEQILGEDDLNDDGFVDYYEFVQAQRKATQSPPPTDST